MPEEENEVAEEAAGTEINGDNTNKDPEKTGESLT